MFVRLSKLCMIISEDDIACVQFMTNFYPIDNFLAQFDLLRLIERYCCAVGNEGILKLYIWLIFCIYQIQALLVSEASPKSSVFP